MPKGKINYICKLQGITPIKIAEQTENLIKDWYTKLTIQEFCDKFKFHKGTVEVYCKKLGIQMLSESLKQKSSSIKTTITQRLSTVRMDDGKWGGLELCLTRFIGFKNESDEENAKKVK